MKQRLVAIATVLLLGIITTLVVAWAPTLGVCRRQAFIRTATEWHSPQGAAIVTAELTHSHRRYPAWMELLKPSVDLGPGERQRRVLHAQGWPLPSMLCVHAEGGNANASQWSRSLHTLHTADREFPLRPIWSGFALDTVFFALSWTAAISFLTLACRLWKSASMRRSQERRQ